MKWKNKGHEFDNIGRLLKNKKNMIIFGAGILGMELFDLIFSLNDQLKWNVYFLDSNEYSRLAQCNRGIFAMSPDELVNFNVDETFVVVCNFHEHNRKDMFDAITPFGYVNMKNAFEHDFFLYSYLSIHFIYNLDKVYISSLNIVPSTVCNLSCKGCLNFNPLIKKHITYSLDELKEDCDTLFNAIDIIGRFQITGGEPFLYKDIIPLLSYVHKKYGHKIVRFEIVTNGTLIPSDDLCLCLSENNVYVFLDDYRSHVPQAEENFQAISEKFDKFRVSYTQNTVSEWFDLNPMQTPRSMSEDELIGYFTSCGCPWATLWNKSLSSCNYSLYAAKAGVVEYDPDNYFDLTGITTDIQKRELIEFRLRFNNKGYVELCRRCSGFSTINKNKLVPAQQVSR
jgi:organic radical activating enzyme